MRGGSGQHKIAGIKAHPLRVPVDFAWLGVDRKSSASMCLVEVTTDTGIVGHGITQHANATTIAAQINALGDTLHGLDALSNVYCGTVLRQRVALVMPPF